MARVVVTVMHEHQELAARNSKLQYLRNGDGLIFGEADDKTIEELIGTGLLVERLPESTDLTDNGYQPKNSLEAYDGLLPLAPTHVVLACNGPIDPAWVDELAKLGGTDISRSGGDQLIVRAETDAELNAIASLDWVIGVKGMPRERRTCAVAAAQPLVGDPLPPDDAPPAWDILVTRPDQASDVVTWATGKGLEVLGSGPRRVRVRVPPGQEALLDETGLAAVPFDPPYFHNDLARAAIGVQGGSGRAYVGAAEVTLAGQGEIVGVADSGLDQAHPDFAGRIVRVIARGRLGDAADPHGHGTHVAGTVLGDGKASDGAYAGVAPGARLFFQSILDARGGLGGLPVDLGELFQEAFDAGARIHNNSWGQPVQSRYTGTSEDVDDFVHTHPEMLIVISAGNEGSNRLDPTVLHPRPDGRVQPISLGAPATSKNALVVGACRSTRTSGGFSERTYAETWGSRFTKDGGAADVGSQRVSGDPEQLAGFSSRGPCIPARRIKPDVVAPGTDILSARSSIARQTNFWSTHENAHYAYMGGTSMAAPVVAGFAALVREYYRAHRNVNAPSAALLKATIINGTRQLSGNDAFDADDGPAAPGPDFTTVPNPYQGFGAVNLPTTLPGPTTRLAFRDVPAASGFTQPLYRHRFTFRTESAGELRVCLAFTDPPGPGLANDLDLTLELPGIPVKTIRGNANLRGKLLTTDAENNVEIVRLTDAPAGRYTVGVLCRNLLKGPQGYALVVLGRLTSDDFETASV